MTINLFIILLVILSAASTLVTEAIKKAYENKEKNPSANLIALIDAIVVGGGGTIASYILIGIPFTAPSIIAIIGMACCVWIGSMVGYDKIIQLVKQIAENK